MTFALLVALLCASPPESGGGFDGGAYLSASGGVALSLQGDSTQRVGASMRSSGGYLWARPRGLKIYLGGGYEFRAARPGARPGQMRQSNGFVMVRVGRGTDTLWAYGLFAPALGMTAHIDDGPFAELFATLSVELGGGVAFRLWRGLFVAGELSFDTGIDVVEPEPRDDLTFLNTRLMLGWSF